MSGRRSESADCLACGWWHRAKRGATSIEAAQPSAECPIELLTRRVLRASASSAMKRLTANIDAAQLGLTLCREKERGTNPDRVSDPGGEHDCQLPLRLRTRSRLASRARTRELLRPHRPRQYFQFHISRLPPALHDVAGRHERVRCLAHSGGCRHSNACCRSGGTLICPRLRRVSSAIGGAAIGSSAGARVLRARAARDPATAPGIVPGLCRVLVADPVGNRHAVG